MNSRLAAAPTPSVASGRHGRTRLVIVAMLAAVGLTAVACVEPPPTADTAPPVLTLPADIATAATSPAGATVTFTATAADDVSGTRPVTCTPASGTVFAVGATTVNCSATDEAGNNASGSFSITVSPYVAPPSDGATMVAAGFNFTCALMNDGGIKCWGGNTRGELGNGTTTSTPHPVDVVGIDSAVDIAAGTSETCAVLDNGTVKCWGESSAGQNLTPTAVAGITDAIRVTMGGSHRCVLRSGGAISCWGRNVDGELGNGTWLDSTAPVTVAGITNAVSVAAGYQNSCAVLADGTLNCWGRRLDQLFVNSNTPYVVSGVTGAVSVGAGVDVACVRINDGTVRCLGHNGNGQLGDGTLGGPPSPTPVTVVGVSNAIGQTTGIYHSCAIVSGGTVQCWGSNTLGQLGDGTYTYSGSAVTASELSSVVQVATGRFHTCGVLADGGVRCWGSNSMGQLGTANIDPAPAPITVLPADPTPPVLTLPADITVAATSVAGAPVTFTATAMDEVSGVRPVTCTPSSGSVFAIGGHWVACTTTNAHGFQVTERFTVTVTPFVPPVDTTPPVLSLPADITVVASSAAGAVVTFTATAFDAVSGTRPVTCTPASGTVFSVGATTVNCSASDEAGNNATGSFSVTVTPFVPPVDTETPVLSLPADITVVASSAAGAVVTFAATAFDAVSGTRAVTCTPTSGSVFAVGSTDVECSATDEAGNTAVGNFLVTVGAFLPATGITAGLNHTCTIQGTGTVQCWGDNSYGQLGDGTTNDSITPVEVTGITNAVDISAGASDSTCAVLADGTSRCWGRNDYGQLGTGSTGAFVVAPTEMVGVSTATRVSVGEKQTCVILAAGDVRCSGYNNLGQLGNGTMFDSPVPLPVIGITTAVSIDIGQQHTCAVLADEALTCWGLIHNGAAGIPPLLSNTPHYVGGSYLSVSAGNGVTCALGHGLITDIECWGRNDTGQLGNGTFDYSLTPTAVFGLTPVASHSTGLRHTCVATTLGTAYCWGAALFMTLGAGEDVTDTSLAVQVEGLSTVASVASGGDHSCALLVGGEVRCWGRNDEGQLGDGSTADSSIPVVSGLGS